MISSLLTLAFPGRHFAVKPIKQVKMCWRWEKRRHCGGDVHKCCSHVFHINNKEFFVNSIEPFIINTFYQFWGVTTPKLANAKIAEWREEALVQMKAAGVIKLGNPEEQALLQVGHDCKDFPYFIKRLPARLVYDCPSTVVSKCSTKLKDGMELFYPVNDTRNNGLYTKYKVLADTETNVIFVGRLAE